ncbi:PIF1-like helicase-domain-containing protein [Glomus cerebriforme]|uniref:ATP-dependent DNA helicase n=1 Tax=Glomus cerebriforme TaxID=658196 RepID=A0A397S0Q1_9GLOM|nr:PIF1-like helicase-domain-containing protein [Glomus cerebriforme]
MPLPSSNINHNSEDLDQLIHEELSYNTVQLENELHQNVPLLNEDQHVIYDAIIQAVKHDCGCFFIDGPGVTSSGIAAVLISDGRTAYSQFKIPIKLNKSSTYNISQRSKEACLINMMKLFIWDEVPMMHKFAFEAVD